MYSTDTFSAKWTQARTIRPFLPIFSHTLPRPTGRSVFGETLIVLSVIGGFFLLYQQGKVSLQDWWIYLIFLAAIVVFYFALLVCRIAFFHGTGGTGEYPWWMHLEDERRKEKTGEGTGHKK